MRSIISWSLQTETDEVRIWKPRALTHQEWPPDYDAVYRWRAFMLIKLRSDPKLLSAARKHYSTRAAEFIMDWMDTYDPRREGSKWIPFVFFTKQEELVNFIDDIVTKQEGGLIEKCRDMGATWVLCAYSVWCWLFRKDNAIGWGSRKEQLVDKLGDTDSLFEKMRLIIKRIPDIWVPDKFNTARHATFMKLLNPANGSYIGGEAGDNIGRGGRKTLYFKDEAQPLSTSILTPDGWKTMGDIKVGDKVIGSNGSPTLVTHVNDCGFAPTYRIEFTDGTFTQASENHLWSVQKMTGSKPYLTMRTHELHDVYRYESPKGRVQYHYRIPTCKPVKFGKRFKHPLDPYIVGVLLGDGSIAKVPESRPSFTTADPEIANEVARLLPEACVLSPAKDGMCYRINDVQGRRGRFKVSRASQAIVDAGIAGCNSWEKFIPKDYLNSAPKDRFSLLQGLMDTDGSASGGVASFHTSSRWLANDVRFLVQSLGGTATLNVKPDKRGYRGMYVLHMVIPDYPAPFRLKRKIEKLRPRRNKPDKRIRKITFLREMLVKCITVDAPDGLYLCNDCIVTHNSAHYERPEKIEAALGDNTNVQVDISSVNGLGNVFHRRRENGVIWEPGKQIDKGFVRVFIMDWRDHPNKTQDWYDARRAKYEREGMMHVFAQEVDRDYSAAVSNTIISSAWIQSAVDAHIKVPYIAEAVPKNLGTWVAGLDVADEGNDRNALTLREWIIWRKCYEWGERDPGVTARRAIVECRPYAGRINCQYDSIGVGAGVKTEYNRLTQDPDAQTGEVLVDPKMIPFIPWNAGSSVLRPYDRIIPDDNESLMNKDFFANLKAQAWWSLRTRFYKTHMAVTEGVVYPVDELISLDSTMPLLEQLKKELAQPTRGSSSQLKMLVDKKPEGTKSPNIADSGVQAYFPVPLSGTKTIVGSYGH